MDILNEFGVKPLLLAAQAVNFLILLFLLKKFLYKPMLKMLDERKAKIAKSLSDADEIESRLLKTTEEQEKRLKEADKEAKTIIEDATKSANQIIKDAQDKASTDIEKMMAKAQSSLDAQRDQLHQEIKGELADLVVLGIEKVVGKVLTEKDKQDIVKKSISNL